MDMMTTLSANSFQVPEFLTRKQIPQFFPLSLRFLEGKAKQLGFPEGRISQRRFIYSRDAITAWLRAYIVVNDNTASPSPAIPVQQKQNKKVTPFRKVGRPSNLERKIKAEREAIEAVMKTA